MNRHFFILFFGVAICLFSFFDQSKLQAEDKDSKIKITTQDQAAKFASKLANEKCKESFNKSPFTPDSYVAQLSDSRWSWGNIEPTGINGFSAEIGFNMDGSEQKVRVVLHTDDPEIVERGSRK